MSIDVPSNSRFSISQPIVTPDGIETFGLMKKFDFLTTDQYTNYEVTPGKVHRPDLIADEVYGSPSFYWIVIMYNRPKNPFRWPENKEVIRLPLASVVIPEL